MPSKSALPIAAFFTIVLVTSAPAQTARPIEIGVKGAALFSTLSVDDAEGAEIETRSSFGGGGFVRIPTGRLALQLELLYLKKGARQTSGDIDPFQEIGINLDYLEVPVLLVLPIDAGTTVSPYVFAGAALAFKVGCNLAGEGPGIDFEIDCQGSTEVDFELRLKDFDLGVVGGAGLRIPAGPGGILLEGRYTFGLMNINDSEDQTSVKNRSAALSIGYSIPVGR